MRALILALALAAGTAHAEAPEPVAPVEVAATPAPSCADAVIAPRLARLLRGARFADVHHSATTIRIMCDGVSLDATRLLGAIALLRLEDREPALAELTALAATGTQRERATVVLGWAHLANDDREAADIVLRGAPPARAAAVRALVARGDRGAFERHLRELPAALQAPARVTGARFRDAHEKSPALAGVLSAIVPGAGQVYAGSWQAAAVTLVLNGLFIAATVELAWDEHYATAAAAGTAASFFYVGGIMNAVDLARRRNQRASAPHADALERLLLPELDGALEVR